MKTIIFEEHSSVLPEWKRHGIKGKTLIYLDAHIDVQLVSEKRIAALENCLTADELAKLEKPHHMLPDRSYSYSIEDFLYPAYCLGMISRLIWVNPHQDNKENPEQSIQKTLHKLQSMEGVSLEDLSKFKRVGNILEGKILGLDVVICDYRDLAKLELPEDSLIDVDIDYFIELPADVPWIDPQEVFTSLQELSVKSEFITLTRSVSSGYTPLRYSFFADYLAALWTGDRANSSHYSRLFDLDSKLQKGEADDVVDGCLEELKQFSDCAATYYLLSLAESNPELAQKYQNQATSLDINYQPNVLRSISELASRDLKFESKHLEELENQLEASDLNQEDLAISHFILGLLYSQLGDFRQVFKHHQIYKKTGNRHPQLNFRLGSLLLQAGHPQRATSFLQAALQDDMTACGAHSLLGRIYAKQGDLKQASEHFLQVSELMPAFAPPVNVLAKIYKQIGDEENSEIMYKKYQRIQVATAILVQKLETGSTV
jgi:tetratricopeptide (TPR) repeat protein